MFSLQDSDRNSDTPSHSTQSTDGGNFDERIYANSRVEDLPIYHNAFTRSTAELLLLNNAQEGTFLIRPSTNPGNFAVSVRLANSVKHFQIDYNGQLYTFGQAHFMTPLQIWIHLQNSPVLECDEGMVAHLTRPYYNENRTPIPLPPSEYSVIQRHYVPEEQPKARSSSTNAVTSKQGPLFKKREGKGWKLRWFILSWTFLICKKNERERKPKRSWDLRNAIHVHKHLDNSKQHCFRILFPSVSYIFSAESSYERDMWLKSIKWQMNAALDRYN